METLRYPTLQAWADGICNAVRAKDGTADPIDHQDVPDRILAIQTGNNIDLSGITAQQSDVSERVQYIDAAGELKYGTMPEITAETKTLDGDNTEYTIEEGHHDGGGKVQIVPETLYAAPSRSTQELESPAGKVYTKVILDPIPDIYKDVSAADAVPGAVLNGYTFYGKAGELESGNIVTKNGKQGATVSANGNRYIPVGYHDGTTYITVNVPQEIVTVEGEDSSNTTAVAADIREGETARSKGKLVTGTMPDVTMDVSIGDIDEDSLLYYAQVKATATVSSGYITGGEVNTTKLIPKFTDSNAITPDTKIVTVATKGKYLDKDIYVSSMPKYSGSYTVTPGDSAQTLYTANKYLSENIVVDAAPAAEGEGINSENILMSGYTTYTFSSIKSYPSFFAMRLGDSSGTSHGEITDLVFTSREVTGGIEYVLTCYYRYVSFDEEYDTDVYARIYTMNGLGSVIQDTSGSVKFTITSSGMKLTLSGLELYGTYRVEWRE